MPSFLPAKTSLLPPIPPAFRYVLGGLLVAALGYLLTSVEWSDAPVPDPDPPPAAIAVPTLDSAILGTALDGTREQRLEVEKEPLRHLLQQALDVGPTVAEALGLPDHPVPLEELRADPRRWRGRWLFYEGEVEYLSGPREGHPVAGRSIYEATLRLQNGDAAMLTFSLPPAAEVVVGSWARAEGFLLKLRDTTYPTAIDRAPLLVGRELLRDYPKWGPVTELDAALLASVDDESYSLGAPVWRNVEEDQTEALWHLAAYARDTFGARTNAEWHKAGTLNNDRHEALRSGKIARGTPMRIFGTLIMRRTLVSPPNPAAIDAWTAAWVQVREYGGGTLVPVWVPKRVAALPERCQVEVRGHFYRWSIYSAKDGTDRRAPLFVAADITQFDLQVGKTMDGIGLLLGGLVLGFLLLVGFGQLRSKAAADRHMQALYALRRRGKPRQPGAEASGGPGASGAAPPSTS